MTLDLGLSYKLCAKKPFVPPTWSLSSCPSWVERKWMQSLIWGWVCSRGPGLCSFASWIQSSHLNYTRLRKITLRNIIQLYSNSFVGDWQTQKRRFLNSKAEIEEYPDKWRQRPTSPCRSKFPPTPREGKGRGLKGKEGKGREEIRNPASFGSCLLWETWDFPFVLKYEMF